MNYPVQFAGDANNIPREHHKRLEEQIRTVLQSISPPDRAPDYAIVSRWFSGYTPALDRKAVLGVEVHFAERRGYATHIIKIGLREEVEADHTGWAGCVGDRLVSSRIFTPVRPVALPERPESPGIEWFAVVYQDAYTLFGPDPETSQPKSLEDVADWAVMDNRPTPSSVERAVAHIYTDLGLWFYPEARSDHPAATAFYRRHLGMDPDTRPEKRVLELWADPAARPVPCELYDPNSRAQLRRHTVWVLCGADRPNADPLCAPPRYIDPIEFVEWSLAPERLPDTLVGPAHGDLHGRNIMLGVRRGEAEYPAVFDYGEMSARNVLAWDFAKLETELKRRLLPRVAEDAEAREQLLIDSGLRPRQGAGAAGRRPGEVARRADRLRCFLAFEEHLDALARGILSRDGAEEIGAAPPARTGVSKVDRLLAVLSRIRKEAAQWLGFDRYKRKELWLDEYYFALAVYGLLNTKWDYEVPERECALVSAGVAAARMPGTPALLKAEIDREKKYPSDPPTFPSYRVPLAVIHGFWEHKEYEPARQYAERTALEPIPVAGGPPDGLAVRAGAAHAVPLVAEAALAEMEADPARLGAVELLLQRFEKLAEELGDYETLGRLGRLYKDSADTKIDAGEDLFPDSPAIQMYRRALAVYERAYDLSGDWYVGINAATLALLTDDEKKAKRIATHVAARCAAAHDAPPGDRYWVLATEGEAAVILGDLGKAKRFYRHALAELTPGQIGMARSTFKQLRRLRRKSKADLDPVLQVFDAEPFRGFPDLRDPRPAGPSPAERAPS
jgi:hypothetical protein